MLVTTAALVNGLLAGGNVDRLLVATPAWEVVGLNGWVDFSRAADLGRGQVVYPVMALGSTALTVLAAATAFVGKRRFLRRALLPVGLSAALMLMALPFSLKAVPFMQSLRTISNGDGFKVTSIWQRSAANYRQLPLWLGSASDSVTQLSIHARWNRRYYERSSMRPLPWCAKWRQSGAEGGIG